MDWKKNTILQCNEMTPKKRIQPNFILFPKPGVIFTSIRLREGWLVKNARYGPENTVSNHLKVAQNSNISVRSLGSNAHFSARNDAVTRGVVGQRAR